VLIVLVLLVPTVFLFTLFASSKMVQVNSLQLTFVIWWSLDIVCYRTSLEQLAGFMLP